MYRTELMDEILKSPKAQEIIQKLSPVYGDAYTALWLFQIIGTALDLMEEWTESLADQAVPQTATWSLPYWEEQYNISADPSWSYERRRQNIINKCITRAPINPSRMASIASVAAGVDARVEEHTGKNHFTVYVSAKPDMVDENYIRKEIDAAKPAHLIYSVVYEQFVENTYYMAGVIQTAKEITLTHY